VGRHHGLLGGVARAVGPGKVQEAVRREAVADDDPVEVEVQALSLGLLGEVLPHLAELLRGDALAFREVLLLGPVVVVGEVRVQLVALPGDLDAVPVREAGQRLLEAALAHVAPWALHIGPNLYLHACRNERAPGPYSRRRGPDVST
jgi:hypothetical protein